MVAVAPIISATECAVEAVPTWAGVRLFVGGHGHRFGGLLGDRCYSPAHPVNTTKPSDPHAVTALLDSGAFSDGPADRLSPAEALARQLRWERKTNAYWGTEGWRARYLVSYDRLIDETWTPDGTRSKRRWSVQAAESAVEETIAAAAYLSARWRELAPRRLVLAAQGVDAAQYTACAAAVLAYAQPGDVLGLGGWCILGRFKTWLPTFEATLWRVVPLAAEAGVRHVHLFGVLWEPALGRLLWLADQHGIAVSTDSSAPTRSGSTTSERARKKAGARAATWEANCAWWVRRLATLRESAHYRAPRRIAPTRQLTLFSE